MQPSRLLYNPSVKNQPKAHFMIFVNILWDLSQKKITGDPSFVWVNVVTGRKDFSWKPNNRIASKKITASMNALSSSPSTQHPATDHDHESRYTSPKYPTLLFSDPV